MAERGKEGRELSLFVLGNNFLINQEMEEICMWKLTKKDERKSTRATINPERE